MAVNVLDLKSLPRFVVLIWTLATCQGPCSQSAVVKGPSIWLLISREASTRRLYHRLPNMLRVQVPLEAV